jgi:hypothetical protein
LRLLGLNQLTHWKTAARRSSSQKTILHERHRKWGHEGEKALQALKLGKIRAALVAAGFDTAAKQATVLGVGRSTAWVVLNRDNRVGPSATVIKRILSSPKLPKVARRKVEEYVKDHRISPHSRRSTVACLLSRKA